MSRRAIRAAIALLSTLTLSARAAAPQDPLREALNLGHTKDQSLVDSFNRGYQLTAAGTIDRAEIVTEFRRAVMFVREREALADYIADSRTLSTALAPFAGLVTVIVEARLNPLNTYTKAPSYELYVSTGPSTKPIVAKPFTREPILPIGATPGSGMYAVRLTASFPRADIEAAAQPAIVVADDRAEVIWQQRIDLSRYR
jgi:hypothetical protein